MKLCSEHFEESSFRITRKNGPLILKPNAIPTLFEKKSTRSAKSVSNIEMQSAVPMNQPVKRWVFVCKHIRVAKLAVTMRYSFQVAVYLFPKWVM